MKRIKIVWLLSLLLMLVIPTGSALAAPGGPLDRIITGDDYVLDDGEREDGNVVVLGGSVEVREGAVLDGDLVVMGGDVEIGGAVTGNVMVMGGDVEVLETSHVHGDCVLIGGDVSITEGARIDGDVVTNPEDDWFPFDRERGRGIEEPPTPPSPPETPSPPSVPSRPTPPDRPEIVYHRRPGFAEKVGAAFLTAITFGVVALLIALFLPRHTDQVRQVVVREPAMSGLVGFLTLLAAALLTPILAVISAVLILVCIGLLGIPLIILLWLAVAAACFMGWAAIGQLAGRWIGNRLGLTGMTPAIEAGLGAFSLSLLFGLVQAIGCVFGLIGGLLNLIVFSVAVGAVVLTRFGRQDYHSGQPILPQRPPKPPVPPASPSPPAAPPAPAAPEPPAPEQPAQAPEKEPADEGLSETEFETPSLDSEGPFPER
jgi:hypothetical protein